MVYDEGIHLGGGPFTTIVSSPMIRLVLHALHLRLEAELRLGVLQPLDLERSEVGIKLRKDVTTVDARVIVFHPCRRAPGRDHVLVHAVRGVHSLKPTHSALN